MPKDRLGIVTRDVTGRLARAARAVAQAAALLLVLTGCPGPDPVPGPEPDPTTVEVTPGDMVFDWFCSAQFLSVTSNGTWSIKSDAPWLTLMTDGGTGNQEVLVIPTDNSDPKARTAHLTVSAGNVSRVVTVTQAPPAVPLSVKFHLGNADSEYDAFSAVVIKFNKPVELLDLERFDTNPQYVFPNPANGNVAGSSQISDDEIGIHFLTRVDIMNNFRIVVRNEFGHEETVRLHMPTYEKRYIFQGAENQIESFRMYNDGKEFLVQTRDRLLRVDAESGAVVRTLDVPSSYGSTLSPYDGRLYYWIPDAPELYSMDMESGSSRLEFTFLPENPDDVYPMTAPIAMGLIADGTGVVALRCPGISSFPRMMFIDTRGEEVKAEDFPDDMYYYRQTLQQTSHNHDYSLLYMSDRSSFAVYSNNGGVRKFEHMEPLLTDVLHGLYPSVIDDRLLVRLNMELFVYDMETGHSSPKCAIDGRHGGGAGFAYVKGYEDYAYVCDGTGPYLSVLDTATGTIMGRSGVGGFDPGGFITDPSGRSFAFRNYAFYGSGEYGFAPYPSEYNFEGSAIYVFDNQVFNTAACPNYNPDALPFNDYFDLDFFTEKSFTFTHDQS